MNKINFSLEKINRVVLKLFEFFWQKNWIFTIVFFVLVLAGSIWVWMDCFYRPIPSLAVKTEFEATREDFNGYAKKIERVIDDLKDKEERFKNTPDYSDQREIFFRQEKDEFAPKSTLKQTPIKQTTPSDRSVQ